MLYLGTSQKSVNVVGGNSVEDLAGSDLRDARVEGGGGGVRVVARGRLEAACEDMHTTVYTLRIGG